MSKIKNGIIGYDMGVPIEFYEREKLLAHPVMDMFQKVIGLMIHQWK